MKTQEIADFLGAELVGDGNIEIDRVAALDTASDGDIAFVEKADGSFASGASCLIVPKTSENQITVTHIRVDQPKLAFSLIAKKLQKHQQRYFGDQHTVISRTAQVRTVEVGAYVTIGENSYIGECSQIGDGVRIGNDVSIGKYSIIHPNCVIYDNVKIGHDCIVHAGSVIGAAGFGYVRDEANGEYHAFPQNGTVVIEDNVEIGANTCIDRGALGETRIGEGTKIDNLVQIAHNVQVGKRVVIAAQTGISGSTVIEDDCVIGGQVGMGDHARVLRGAVIGSQAGVLPGKIVRPGIWWGTPVQPLGEYKRQNALVKGLKRLVEDVKELKKSRS